MKRLLFVLLAFSVSCWATLPGTVTWNVEKTTGASDTNGGGFDTAKSGTDYSQSGNNGGSCAAKLYIDGSTVTATANAATVTFTGGTHTVASAEAGNIVYLATGSGLAVGWYEISSVNVGAVQWTLERTTGMSGGAITGYMGGCLATPQQALTNMGSATPSAIDQTSYIKVGTSAYAVASAVTVPTMAAYNLFLTRVVGYATAQTDRGLFTVSGASVGSPTTFTVSSTLPFTSGSATLCDVKGGTGNWAAVNGTRTVTLTGTNTLTVPVDSTAFGALTGTITISIRPLLATSGSGTSGISVASSAIGWQFENLIIDGTSSSGTAYGLTGTANYVRLVNVWIKSFPLECYRNTGNGLVFYAVEMSGCAGTNAAVDDVGATGVYMAYSYVHDNTKSGVYLSGAGGTFVGNVFANNTGATSDGVSFVQGGVVVGNLFYGNGRDGFRDVVSYGMAAQASIIIGNRFEYNGVTAATAYGLDSTAATTFPALPHVDYNSYYGNKTAAVHGLTQGTHDVIPSGDPSIARSGTPPNFGLNSTAGAGKALEGVGMPGLLPGLGSSIGYADIGPLRHADPTSTTTGSGSYSWVR